MTRLAAVEPGSDPAAIPVEERLVAARGEISHLYRVLLNSVAAADGWEYFLTIVRQKLSLPPRLRELVILRIAMLNSAPYEFEAHVPHARKAGLQPAEIEELQAGRVDQLTELDRLAISYVDAMTRDIQVDEALFRQVEAALGARQTVDLTVTIGAYNMVSRVLAALGIE